MPASSSTIADPSLSQRFDRAGAAAAGLALGGAVGATLTVSEDCPVARDPAPARTSPPPSDVRLSVAAPIEVMSTSGLTPATLMEISRAGMTLDSDVELGTPGAAIELFLPGPASDEITVLATLVRSRRIGARHRSELSVRLVEPCQRAALRDLLRLLLDGPGGGSRKHPRVAVHEPAWVAELGHPVRLISISQGGAGFVVPRAQQPGELLTIFVADPLRGGTLELRGRVVNRRRSVEHGPPAWHIGLQFVDLSDDRRARLRHLIAERAAGR